MSQANIPVFVILNEKTALLGATRFGTGFVGEVI